MNVRGFSNTNWSTYKFSRQDQSQCSYDISKRDAAKIVVELAKLGDKSAQALVGKGPFAAIRLRSAIKNGKLIQDKQGQAIAIGQAVQHLLDELPLCAFKAKAFSKKRWKMNKSVLRQTFQSEKLNSINQFHELKQEFEALTRQKETKERQLLSRFGQQWRKRLPEENYVDRNGQEISRYETPKENIKGYGTELFTSSCNSGKNAFKSPYESWNLSTSTNHIDLDRLLAMNAMNIATRLRIAQYDDLLNSQNTSETNTSGLQQIIPEPPPAVQPPPPKNKPETETKVPAEPTKPITSEPKKIEQTTPEPHVKPKSGEQRAVEGGASIKDKIAFFNRNIYNGINQ